MARTCTNCKQLDALNTDLTNMLRALIKGEAEGKYPLLDEWLQQRDIAWFNHFCEQLEKHIIIDEPITISSLKLSFLAIHLHPEKLEIVEVKS